MNPALLLGRAGAILILLALLTGILVANAMSGSLPADGPTVLASHLAGLMGGFWIFAVAWSLPLLRYGDAGKRRLAWLVIVPQFANWAITLLKAFLKVAGIAATGEPKNDAILGLLTAFVVLPSIVAAGAWVWGFHGAPLAGSRPPV